MTKCTWFSVLHIFVYVFECLHTQCLLYTSEPEGKIDRLMHRGTCQPRDHSLPFSYTAQCRQCRVRPQAILSQPDRFFLNTPWPRARYLTHHVPEIQHWAENILGTLFRGSHSDYTRTCHSYVIFSWCLSLPQSSAGASGSCCVVAILLSGSARGTCIGAVAPRIWWRHQQTAVFVFRI